MRRIKEYVLARLREELSHAPRGSQAQLAKELGVSGAHLSNMLSSNPTRQPGEDFRRKVAAHWNITYAELEAFALGEKIPGDDSGTESSDASRTLSAVLREYTWMPELTAQLRKVVREQAAQHIRFGNENFTSDEWHRILTGLEREALALLARRDELESSTRTRSGVPMRPSPRARKSRPARA